MRMLAAAPRQIDWPEIALWLGVLALLIIAAVIAVALIRRAVRGGATAAAGFTLQDLREMHERGDLTDAEYQAARTAARGEAARTLSDTPRAAGAETDRPGPRL